MDIEVAAEQITGPCACHDSYTSRAKIAMEMDYCISGEEYCGKDISDAILTIKSKGENK